MYERNVNIMSENEKRLIELYRKCNDPEHFVKEFMAAYRFVQEQPLTKIQGLPVLIPGADGKVR